MEAPTRLSIQEGVAGFKSRGWPCRPAPQARLPLGRPGEGLVPLGVLRALGPHGGPPAP